MPLLLWLVASGLVYGNLKLLQRHRDNVAALLGVVAAARRMDAFGGQMLESTASLILLRDGRLLGAYEEAWQLFIDSAAVAEEAPSHQEQQQMLGEIRALARRVDGLSRQSFDYLKNGDADRAIRVLASEESRQLQKRFGELLDKFTASEEERLNVLEREAESLVDSALWWTIASVVVAAFLTIVWGARNASADLRHVKQVAKDMVAAAVAVSLQMQESERAASRAANLVELAAASLSQLSVASDLSARQVSGVRDRLELLAEKMVFLRHLLESLQVVTNQVDDITQMANVLAVGMGVAALRRGLTDATGSEPVRSSYVGASLGGDLAIVAADIRQLAEETQKSARQIHDIITDIQNHALVGAKSSSPLLGDEDNSDLALARQNLEQMVGALGQCAIGVAQLTEAMQTLQATSRQNLSDIGRTTMEMENLKNAAIHLNQVLTND
ncbi:MAG: hypothetical protein Fur0025_03580 [Oscillatoriaceae cyanobacterium]